MRKTILIIGGNEHKYSLLSRHLADLNYATDDIYWHATIADALPAAGDDIALVLADLSHEANNLSALHLLQNTFLNIPLIVLLDKGHDDLHTTHETAHGYLVYGQYDTAKLATAITGAKMQKALAMQVKEQQEHLDNILFSINDAIWSRTADTLELTYANNAYYRLYGHSREEQYPDKRQIFKSIHPGDREPFFTALHELRTTGTSQITYRHMHEDGLIKTLKSTSTLKKGVNGLPDTIHGITVDITKETELTETIRNSEQKLLATINNTKDLIWSVNRELEIIFCNKPYQDFIHSLGGITPKEGDFVLGDWGSESFINSRTKDYERALDGESFTTIVEEMYKGELMYNEISSSPIIDHDGNIAGVNCIARDISQQKKQFIRIREQNEKLREIAWIQSHKVRSPVASILGLAALFDHETESHAYNQDILERLKRVTNELDKVIKEVVESTVDLNYTIADDGIINSQD